jgi:hypothetical protein
MSDSILVDKQPSAVAKPEVQSYSLDGQDGQREQSTPRSSGNLVQRFKGQFLTREGWLGEYNWGELCMPRLWPYRTKNSKLPAATPFYALEDKLPILLAATCGLQHSLAMLAGLITPPIIFANEFQLSGEVQSYMISASLIACGILSAIQMSAIPIKLPYFGRLQIGTGVLSVVGTSFATLSTVSAIATSLYADGTCPSITAADGTVTRGSCPDGE